MDRQNILQIFNFTLVDVLVVPKFLFLLKKILFCEYIDNCFFFVNGLTDGL